MPSNPFDVGGTDEFVPVHDVVSSTVIHDGVSDPVGDAPAGITSGRIDTDTDSSLVTVNVDVAGPFPFPPEAKMTFQIYGKNYAIPLKHLLVCPQEWLGAMDNGILDLAIEAADSWITVVFQGFLDARVRLEMYKHDCELRRAQMRKQAELSAIETIQKEVESKKRDKFKTPTIDDIESTKMRLFSSELTEMSAVEVKLECDMLRLEDLHKTLRNRSFVLDKISARLHADKTRR
ncbi:MAG: hypothetical protein WC477_07820 [Patescibacteria group bacterium]